MTSRIRRRGKIIVKRSEEITEDEAEALEAAAGS
jgi:hypothetical protein